MAANSVYQAPFAERPKFQNIDLLRFVAASIVVLWHIAIALPVREIRGFSVPRTHFLFDSIIKILCNGHAAVMLFFVVSGVCINMPYAQNRPLNLGEFYVRRYVRIGPPLFVAYLLSWAVTGLWNFDAIPVVWSLWCEAIYYLIFPALIVAIARVGFGTVFFLSCVACGVLSLAPDREGGHGWQYGPLLTWIVFLPVWLAGVWISENASLALLLPSYLRSKRAAAIGGAAIFLLSIIWMIVRFHVHGGIDYPIYMILVFSAAGAAFIFVLLQVDLSDSKLIRFLDRQGRWSYSLYLVHFPILNLFTLLLINFVGVDGLNNNLIMLASACFLVTTYALALGFYEYVEKPSHMAAKYLGLWVRNASGVTIRRSPAVRDESAPATIVSQP